MSKACPDTLLSEFTPSNTLAGQAGRTWDMPTAQLHEESLTHAVLCPSDLTHSVFDVVLQKSILNQIRQLNVSNSK